LLRSFTSSAPKGSPKSSLSLTFLEGLSYKPPRSCSLPWMESGGAAPSTTTGGGARVSSLFAFGFRQVAPGCVLHLLGRARFPG
jgi:hypothetical protein